MKKIELFIMSDEATLARENPFTALQRLLERTQFLESVDLHVESSIPWTDAFCGLRSN